MPLSKEKPDLNKKVHEVPHKPGVYLMRDRFGRVIYVGKARDLRKRVGSYFMPSKMAVADLKTRALLEAVWDFETHTVASEAESLLLEGKLIKEYRPRYNISFRDDKRFLVVKVDPTEEWPRFRLARFKKDDGARYFGPYAHAGALRQTLNFMRKKFGVLTFGRGAPTERELKSSTYQVPMRLSEINAETYRQRVAQAAEFLEGHSREMINALKEEMRKAAAKLDFEKAAELRNMLEDLRRTTKPMRRFTRHSLPTTIDPQADVQALADALQLPHLPRVMECFDISIFPRHTWSLRWFRFATACPTKIITGVIASEQWRDRMISRAWQRSLGGATRGCCSRHVRKIRTRRSFRRRTRWKHWRGLAIPGAPVQVTPSGAQRSCGIPRSHLHVPRRGPSTPLGMTLLSPFASPT